MYLYNWLYKTQIPKSVIPAKAGIQKTKNKMDPGLRRDDNESWSV